MNELSIESIKYSYKNESKNVTEIKGRILRQLRIKLDWEIDIIKYNNIGNIIWK